MQIVKAAVLYFALVFGAGFVLGPIRILWVAPRLGARVAELLEAPSSGMDNSETRCSAHAVESTRYG